ncbi:DUF2807 domain-containing protein [Cytophagaceae bacterium DM2B3-1]|uniref:DUF2807 domain-containing protein n=1 Tax=Xanthocytophaga flava TaxID=3048013 RepID=A0ABT7CTU4_9BACT|nr:DUF2807 domain-containing protein [Xanthocytophaga flavus]MDJ1497193.1 DUF2807 domain-containing protein [Xanthocytophaga flavus]
MKKAIQLFLLVLVFAGLISCEVEEVPPKPLGSFTTITSNGFVTFNLVGGPVNKVISTSMSDAYYNVSNGNLFINGMGTITIAVRNLYLLSCNSCSVKSAESFTADTLNFSIHAGSLKLKDVIVTRYLGLNAINTGTYEISGRTPFLNLGLTNMVTFKGYSLITDSTYVNSTNVVDCEVYTKQVINAFVNSIGNVNYKGRPPIVRASYTGTGRLVAK